MELVREYIRKSDRATFIRFENENVLYCDDDDTGANDIRVSEIDLMDNFIFKKEYWED